jgi:polysaccharide biosynthesis transport protein
MSTSTPDAPRYATLRDYVRVIRTNRLLILAITLACGVVAFALTAREKKTYQAQASVFFQDTTQYANLVGTQIGPSLPDVTRAQINAQKVTSIPVLDEVRKELGLSHSRAGLGGSVSTAVNAQTNAVVIQATAATAVLAERLANTFATATQTVVRNQTRSQFKQLLAGAKSEFSQLINTPNNSVTRAAYVDRIGTLQFLAQTADPVQIVQQASIPTSPAGPRTLRNTIIGLLLGLTIAIIAAFGRDALDRRLRSAGEITGELGWPILGYVRESAFGAPVFLNSNRNANSQVAEGDRESFRILRQNIRFLNVDDAPRSVVVTSALPEEGKSTVASSLACASAAAGARTLLVECDLRRPSLGRQFELNSRPGLSDFLLGDASPSEILQLVALPSLSPTGAAPVNGNSPSEPDADDPDQRRLVCISAGRPVPESAELLNSKRFKQFLREVESAYDQVILDASPLLSVADTAVLLPEAQATLICVRAGRTTHDEASALKLAVDRLPHRLIGVVVTGVRPGAEHDLGYYSNAYAYEAAAR